MDGGHINVRTGLRKRTNDLKNGQNFEGNGDGKMQGILELIKRFGGGDGKRPSDRTEKKIESEKKNDKIDQGFSRW